MKAPQARRGGRWRRRRGGRARGRVLNNRAACRAALREYDLVVTDCTAALALAKDGLKAPMPRRRQRGARAPCPCSRRHTSECSPRTRMTRQRALPRAACPPRRRRPEGRRTAAAGLRAGARARAGVRARAGAARGGVGARGAAGRPERGGGEGGGDGGVQGRRLRPRGEALLRSDAQEARRPHALLQPRDRALEVVAAAARGDRGAPLHPARAHLRQGPLPPRPGPPRARRPLRRHRRPKGRAAARVARRSRRHQTRAPRRRGRPQ